MHVPQGIRLEMQWSMEAGVLGLEEEEEKLSCIETYKKQRAKKKEIFSYEYI